MELRAAIRDFMLPIVKKYFFAAVDCVKDDYRAELLQNIFVDVYTCSSAGASFQPISHKVGPHSPQVFFSTQHLTGFVETS